MALEAPKAKPAYPCPLAAHERRTHEYPGTFAFLVKFSPTSGGTSLQVTANAGPHFVDGTHELLRRQIEREGRAVSIAHVHVAAVFVEVCQFLEVQLLAE